MGKVIQPYLRVTPTLEVPGADFGLPDVRLHFKLESLQPTGSFKVRGAFANLLTREIPPVGVAAASGGNHGVAVAYAAMKLGKPAQVFVPEVASPTKIERIRSYGANLVVRGAQIADAFAACEAWVAESGALRVHPFDQTETVLGQGTLAMELDAQAPGLDTILVPVGGGGLINGIAAWYRGKAKVIGIEPEAAPTLTRALEAGHPVDVQTGGIAADSLAPRRTGELNYRLAREDVHRMVLVPDEAIRTAQQALWENLRVVAEPGGATALAALLVGAYKPQPGERIGVIVTGGNTVAVDFGR